MRAVLGEVVARLERAGVQLRRGVSAGRVIARLDERAAADDPELAGAPLEALLVDLGLSLGALGQAVGVRAVERARATAARLAVAKKVKKAATPSDPAVARDLAELRAGRLPDGFEVLSVVRALLA